MATITQEIRICDRCKKELKDNNYASVTDHANGYFYELCDECHKDYLDYKKEIEELWNQQQSITKEHRFGLYMYKTDEPEVEEAVEESEAVEEVEESND